MASSLAFILMLEIDTSHPFLIAPPPRLPSPCPPLLWVQKFWDSPNQGTGAKNVPPSKNFSTSSPALSCSALEMNTSQVLWDFLDYQVRRFQEISGKDRPCTMTCVTKRHFLFSRCHECLCWLGSFGRAHTAPLEARQDEL